MKSKVYKYVIGLDISLTEPGWAKYDLHNESLTFDVINTKKLKGMQRIDHILGEVYELINNEEVNTLVIIEGYSFASRGNSAISLGECGGVIRHGLWRNEVDYIELPPTQLKKFISGSGTSGKELIIRDIYRYYDIVTDNNNAADAIGLCMVGRAVIDKPFKKLNKDQEKIIEGLKKE